MNKNTRYRSFIPLVFSLVAIFAFIIYFAQNVERYYDLLTIKTEFLVILIVFICFVMLGNGLINYLCYRGLGILISLNESVGLSAINTMANQLPFTGGIVAKGFYLNKRYQFEYLRFISATVALYVLFIFVSGLLGLATLVFQAFVQDISAPYIMIFGFVGMISIIGLYWIPLNIGWFPNKLNAYLVTLWDGWQILRRDRNLVVKIGLVQILTLLAMAGRYWIVFRVLSQDVNYSACILFSTAAILTHLVTITPGGLGVTEAIVAGVASVLGFNFGVSVVAVGIDRLVATTVIIVLGIFYTYYLSKIAPEKSA